MDNDIKVNFKGGFCLPGISKKRIVEDHLHRYHFASTFAKGKSVLDIACGAGYSAPMFIQGGAVSYNGIDLNEQRVDYATQTYGTDKVTFSVGDICTYGDGNSYDMITCFETIEHVENYESALTNLYNLLKPGGLLLISTPNRPVTSPNSHSLEDKPKNPHHAQEFTSDELTACLCRAGFDASKEPIYGQRQRRMYNNIILRIAARVIFGNPNKKASPAVTPVKDKMPRYVIIVALKN